MSRFYEEVFGVHFDDLDMFGILHNARYLLMFERAIGGFWKRMGWGGPPDYQTNPDQFHLVRTNQMEYLRAVEGLCEVRVRLTIARLGQSSLTFQVRVMPMDQDIDYAVGSRVIVKIDPHTRRPVPWTEGFRKALVPYVIAAPEEAPSPIPSPTGPVV